MRSANLIPRVLTLACPAHWADDYTFSGNWNGRKHLSPWTWWAPDDAQYVNPHFSIFDGDVNRGYLVRFHITHYLHAQTHMPLHIYYNVDQAGRVRYTNTDANRLGSESQNGLTWVNDNASMFDQLAQEFVSVAVGD